MRFTLIKRRRSKYTCLHTNLLCRLFSENRQIWTWRKVPSTWKCISMRFTWTNIEKTNIPVLIRTFSVGFSVRTGCIEKKHVDSRWFVSMRLIDDWTNDSACKYVTNLFCWLGGFHKLPCKYYQWDLWKMSRKASWFLIYEPFPMALESWWVASRWRRVYNVKHFNEMDTKCVKKCKPWFLIRTFSVGLGVFTGWIERTKKMCNSFKWDW